MCLREVVMIKFKTIISTIIVHFSFINLLHAMGSESPVARDYNHYDVAREKNVGRRLPSENLVNRFARKNMSVRDIAEIVNASKRSSEKRSSDTPTAKLAKQRSDREIAKIASEQVAFHLNEPDAAVTHQSKELIATHHNAVIPYQKPEQAIFPNFYTTFAAPQAFEAPRFIIDEPALQKDMIKNMISNQNSGDVVPRFEQAIGISDLFTPPLPPNNNFANVATNVITTVSNVVGATSPQVTNVLSSDPGALPIYVDTIISYYQSQYPKSLIDPIVQLEQDKKILQAIKPTELSDESWQNKMNIIVIADNAENEMIKKIKNDSLPSAGVSVYEVVADLKNKIANIEDIKNNQLGVFESGAAVCKDYEDIYTEILKPLQSIENKVLDVEQGIRANSRFSEDVQKNFYVKFKNDPLASQVQAQINLDKITQEKEARVVDEEATTIFERLSPGIRESNIQESCKAVVKTALQEFLSKQGSVIDSSFKEELEGMIGDSRLDVDTVVGDLHKHLIEIASQTVETPDFKIFMENTRDLQSYTEAISQLVETSKKIAAQIAHDAAATNLVTNYITRLLPKNNTTTSADIDAIFGTPEKPGNLLLVYNRLHGIDDKSVVADREDIAAFNQYAYPTELPNTTTNQELVVLYDQIMKQLLDMKANLKVGEDNARYVENQANALWERSQQLKKSADPLQDSIIEALTVLKSDLSHRKIAEATVQAVGDILNDYEKGTKDDKAVLDAIRALPIQDDAIVAYAKVINQLITSVENKNYQSQQQVIVAIVNSLQDKVQAATPFFSANVISRNTILKAKAALKKLPQDADPRLVKAAVRNFSADVYKILNEQKFNGNKIPNEQWQEIYSGVLDGLLTKAHDTMNDTIIAQGFRAVGRGASYVGRTISPGNSASVQNQQQDIAHAVEVLRRAKTPEENETAFIKFLGVMLNTKYQVGGVMLLAATIVAPFAQPAFLNYMAQRDQIQQNNNLTQQQKDALTQLAAIAAAKDVANAVISDKLGADLATIQSGNVQDIAESIALNQALGFVDPTMKDSYRYSPNKMQNSKKFEASYKAWVKAQARNKSTVVYPSYADLLAMEHEHNKSLHDYGTTILDDSHASSPSSSVSPDSSASLSLSSTHTSPDDTQAPYSPYTSSPYLAAAG